MSDVIFVAATIVFFAICALYVHWCDKIIGPDDFRSTSESGGDTLDDGVRLVAADLGSKGGVTA
ncbi:MAG: hypothetical protein ACXV5U_03895 [Ilumatobacteraceae bacterium]